MWTISGPCHCVSSIRSFDCGLLHAAISLHLCTYRPLHTTITMQLPEDVLHVLASQVSSNVVLANLCLIFKYFNFKFPAYLYRNIWFDNYTKTDVANALKRLSKDSFPRPQQDYLIACLCSMASEHWWCEGSSAVDSMMFENLKVWHRY